MFLFNFYENIFIFLIDRYIFLGTHHIKKSFKFSSFSNIAVDFFIVIQWMTSYKVLKSSIFHLSFIP